MIRGLDKLRKRPKDELRTLAKNAGIKISVGWNRTVLATRILEKRKLSELDVPEPSEQPEPESEPGQSKRKLDFETLASEAPEIAPDLPQGEKVGAGGRREGAGRPLGFSEEEIRVQKILQNKIPDPMVQFVVESVFGLVREPVEVVEPTPKMIAVPATNLLAYYFPNLNVSPVLRVWFELFLGTKNLAVRNLEKRKAEAKAKAEPEPEPEPEPTEQ